MMDFTKFKDAHKEYLKIVSVRNQKAPHAPYIRRLSYDESYTKLATLIDADPMEVAVVFANLFQNNQMLNHFKDTLADMFTIGKIFEEDALRDLSSKIRAVNDENTKNIENYNSRLEKFNAISANINESVEPKIEIMRDCWINFVDELQNDFDNVEYNDIKNILVKHVKTCEFDELTQTYKFDWELLKNIHPEHARQLIYTFEK